MLGLIKTFKHIAILLRAVAKSFHTYTTNEMNKKDIRYYWDLKDFTPNPKQEQAILHTEGPLFLTAGPAIGG